MRAAVGAASPTGSVPKQSRNCRPIRACSAVAPLLYSTRLENRPSEGTTMKSPFPGMDPYIEAYGFWPDFHARLIGQFLQRLEDALPRKYRVRTELREIVELVEAEGKEKTSIYP